MASNDSTKSPGRARPGISVGVMTRDPGLYNVVMLNDDFTTMDFVVSVLEDIFFMNRQNALSTMLHIHNNGSAVVGRYTLDICRARVDKTTRLARQNGFPLQLKITPADA